MFSPVLRQYFSLGKRQMDIVNSLFEGFGKNVLIFFATLAGALPLGFLIMFASRSKFKPLAYVMRTLVWVVRGTPLMLQLIAVFYLPSFLFSVTFDRIWAAIIAFIINYACYFSEIYRGGLESIPRGQYEACQVLGMTQRQGFLKVIFMQVVKRITAPMGNEIITLIKDTSLANIIAVGEIIMTSKRFLAGGQLWPFFSTAVFFLLFNGAVTLLLSRAEKKMSYYKI